MNRYFATLNMTRNALLAGLSRPHFVRPRNDDE